MNKIDVMKQRVLRLANMSRQCLVHSRHADIGVKQTEQLNAMSAQLDAMCLTCQDCMRIGGGLPSPSERAVRLLVMIHSALLRVYYK